MYIQGLFLLQHEQFRATNSKLEIWMPTY